MTAKEREQRKTLLLIKGDALRLQLGLEIGLVRQRLSLAGTLSSALPQLVATLFGVSGARSRGFWRVVRLALGGLSAWRAFSAWLKRA
jgi:hypothetical protein